MQFVFFSFSGKKAAAPLISSSNVGAIGVKAGREKQPPAARSPHPVFIISGNDSQVNHARSDRKLPTTD